ncbi:MAG: phosphoadenosine phosphosulfate reductase family protein, partial [Hyphomicrobiales bacterium]|nr:phosphoadenosine phosphosulfate reductase family protein [Hyphomicrobiales bacterium]
MSAHDVKMFGDQIAASRLESRFARVKATSLVRLVIEDLYPGRVALVSSFGADAAALLHMVSRVDKSAPVIFVDTGQHFPETLAYRDELCAALGLSNVVVSEPRPETLAQEDPEK